MGTIKGGGCGWCDKVETRWWSFPWNNENELSWVSCLPAAPIIRNFTGEPLPRGDKEVLRWGICEFEKQPICLAIMNKVPHSEQLSQPSFTSSPTWSETPIKMQVELCSRVTVQLWAMCLLRTLYSAVLTAVSIQLCLTKVQLYLISNNQVTVTLLLSLFNNNQLSVSPFDVFVYRRVLWIAQGFTCKTRHLPKELLSGRIKLCQDWKRR